MLLIQRKRFPIRVHIVDSFGNLAGRSGDRYRNWNRREGNFWRSVPLIHESRVTAFTTARAFSLSWAKKPAMAGAMAGFWPTMIHEPLAAGLVWSLR